MIHRTCYRHLCIGACAIAVLSAIGAIYCYTYRRQPQDERNATLETSFENRRLSVNESSWQDIIVNWILENKSTQSVDIEFDRDPLEHLTVLVFNDRGRCIHMYNYGGNYPPDNRESLNSILTIAPKERYTRKINVSDCFRNSEVLPGAYELLAVFGCKNGAYVAPLRVTLSDGRPQ